MRVGTNLTRTGMNYGKKPEYPEVCCGDEWQAGYGGGYPITAFSLEDLLRGSSLAIGKIFTKCALRVTHNIDTLIERGGSISWTQSIEITLI